ncbi:MULTISPECIES: hypothetical protein [Pectobacterium]|nr:MULTISPECIES: hypothetical protein [Pectobacterium]QQG28260.1 hypothetical protein JFY74_19780 [Pectobacterium carotovorum]
MRKTRELRCHKEMPSLLLSDGIKDNAADGETPSAALGENSARNQLT